MCMFLLSCYSAHCPAILRVTSEWLPIWYHDVRVTKGSLINIGLGRTMRRNWSIKLVSKRLEPYAGLHPAGACASSPRPPSGVSGALSASAVQLVHLDVNPIFLIIITRDEASPRQSYQRLRRSDVHGCLIPARSSLSTFLLPSFYRLLFSPFFRCHLTLPSFLSSFFPPFFLTSLFPFSSILSPRSSSFSFL